MLFPLSLRMPEAQQVIIGLPLYFSISEKSYDEYITVVFFNTLLALFQNNNSIRNYAEAVTDHIRSAQKNENREDGGPFSLGIWFNRWRTTWISSPTTNSVKRQIANTAKKEDQLELERIFYKPNSRQLRKIDETADIARSIMDARGLTGVVRYIRA